jgi:hypothetical protein
VSEVAVAAAETDTGSYPSLCCRCHRMAMFSPEQSVVAEARAIVGDITVVFCGDCIRQATARMVDGAAESGP